MSWAAACWSGCVTELGIVYSVTTNLGDEIQQVALIDALTSLGATPTFEVNRDTLRPQGPMWPHNGRLIVSGWLAERRETLARIAPSLAAAYVRDTPIGLTYFDATHVDATDVQVMYIGAHFNPELIADIGTNAKLRSHLIRCAPIGARDLDTVRRLGSLGIPAWFSGCLTLQLRRPHPPRSIGTLLVDAEGEGMRVSQEVSEPMADEPSRVLRRRALARERINLFASAQRVITNRLHAALPCIALGTEVQYADPGWVRACDRFTGLIDLTPSRVDHLRDAQVRALRQFLDLPVPSH